jgi:hypothetical protein
MMCILCLAIVVQRSVGGESIEARRGGGGVGGYIERVEL